MNPELWKYLSYGIAAVGGMLAVLGSFGSFYFGNKVEKAKEILDKQEKEIFTGKIDQLVRGNEQLQTSLLPFKEAASKLYPDIGQDAALTKLQTDLSALDQRANQIEKQIEEADPKSQPIRTATATVEIIVKTDTLFNNHFMDSGGFFALGKGDKPLLIAEGIQSIAKHIGGSKAIFRGVWHLDAANPSVGQPIQGLMGAEYAQISFSQLPDNSEIAGGNVRLILNNSIQLDFEIPGQRASGKNVVSRSIGKVIAMLAAKPKK